MILVETATITYQTPDGVETLEDTEIIYDESTAHWQLRPESGTVIRIPRERVYRVAGGPDKPLDCSQPDNTGRSSDDSERETDEYGHPM